MKLKVGVIFGGNSVEHEISVISALQAMDNIDKEKYDIIPIYIAKNKDWYVDNILFDITEYKDLDLLIKKCKKVVLQKIDDEFCLVHFNKIHSKIINRIDVIIPVVHGKNIEDGTLQGYLETVGIPYAGCSTLGASLGQDKVVMKQIFSSCNIPIVPYVWFYDNEYLLNKDEYIKKCSDLGYPVVVKPATLGSSIGIKCVKNDEELESAINEAITYDNKIVVEKAISNLIEANCSVLGNYESSEASTLEQVLSSNDILTFKDKYIGNSKAKGPSKGMASTSRIIPANIDDDLTKKIQETSKEVFKVLNLSGVCRIDYLIDGKTKEYYVNEPNTIPGSLSFYLWEASNKKYSELLDDLIKLAIKDYKNKTKKVASFDTNVLKDYKKGGIKK